MYDKIECGNRLKHLRKVKGKTQHEVASEIGISVDTIRKLEQGKRTPSVIIVDRLREYYKTTADYIISGIKEDSHDLLDKDKQLIVDSVIEGIKKLIV